MEPAQPDVHPGVRAVVGVPVLAEGRLWGVMAVGSSRPAPLPADTELRLASLALKARTIETMTPRPADEIQVEVSRLADGLGTAMDELREISHGIHPAILSESGLGPALEALARRSAVPVELDLNLGSRFGEQVEAAGYYIASEALANVAKHAQASVIEMRVTRCDGALTLSISDDGVGGADPGRGSGLIGLKTGSRPWAERSRC